MFVREAYILAGPTASGKSALAATLARELGAWILSADSMLVYRGMDVGTAKPSAEERAEFHMGGVDIVTPAEEFSSGAWLRAASAWAETVPPEKPIVIVGGTGLYFSALLRGLDREWEKPAPEYPVIRIDRALVRARIAARLEAMYSAGLEAEKARLHREYPVWSRTAALAIGYREGDSKEKVLVRTCQLAKRQDTWFRHQATPLWVEPTADAVRECWRKHGPWKVAFSREPARPRSRWMSLLAAVMSLAVVGFTGCRIDHCALVRVTVRDVVTDEPVTNGTCEVCCTFPCYSFLDALSWKGGQRCETSEKTLRPEDGGVKWFFGHGNTETAFAYVRTPPVGYYHSHLRGGAGGVAFSRLMTFIPIPIHFPPLRTATVYVRRQYNPILTEWHGVHETCGPRVNDVFQGTYRPTSWAKPTLTNAYEFSAGYDCVKGDYCPPFGKGETADIVFTHSYEYLGEATNRSGKAIFDYVRKRTMRFPGQGNGLVFRNLPKSFLGHEFTQDDVQAPVDGYVQEHVSAYGPNVPEEQDYVDFDFRIRCQYDENGELTSCQYGRFRGRYCYRMGLEANLYVNPRPLDRNLEVLNGLRQEDGRVWRWE